MLSPKVLINLSLLVAAGITALFISLILVAPYSGFVLQQLENSEIWEVTRIEPWVEQQGLSIGSQVRGIAPLGGPTLEIEYYHIPSLSTESRIKDLDRAERSENLTEIYNILTQPEIEIVLSNGNSIALTLDQSRPLSSLPVTIWIEFLIAIAAPLMGALVWAWQPKKPETVLLLLSGVGFFLMSLPSALSIYAIDMLYLPSFLFWLLRTGVDVGQCVFFGCGSCVLLYFPKRLADADLWRKRVLLGLLAFAIVAFLSSWKFENGADQFLFFPDPAELALMLTFFSLTVWLCYLQWKESRNKPVERAQTLWVLLSWTIGPGLFLIFAELPKQLGYTQLLDGVFANLSVLSIYIMLLLGIARFNLFQLEQHIGLAYQWTLVTFLFFGLDIALISLVNMAPQISSLIVLALVLWGYLPIRQWFHQRFFMNRQHRYQRLFNDAVVLMVRNSLDSDETPRKTWQLALGVLFSPVEINSVRKSGPTQLAERGEKLLVAANHYSPELSLRYADNGARLFTKEDTELLHTLELLFEKLYGFRDAYLAGQTEERNRIRRDLHDQVGHKLLSLIYSASDDKSRSLAKETMSQLSELIQALKHETVALVDVLTQLKVLSEDACEHAGLEFKWEESLPSAIQSVFNSNQYLNVLNIQRELLNNAIRHAQASKITVTVKVHQHVLAIIFCDDGIGFSQKTVKPGNGLFNIQSRIKELKATVDWSTSSGTQVLLKIPLNSSGGSNENK